MFRWFGAFFGGWKKLSTIKLPLFAVKKRTYMAGAGVVEVGRLGGAGVVLPFHGRGVRIFRGPPILA